MYLVDLENKKTGNSPCFLKELVGTRGFEPPTPTPMTVRYQAALRADAWGNTTAFIADCKQVTN